ncbi:MAG: BamA/TamA family outer membrane protein [Bacteroidota bacterium]
MNISLLNAQSPGDSITVQADTVPPPKGSFDLLPAISYSPETQLTLGIIGYYYPTWGMDKPGTTQSNLNFLAVYTTARQLIFETNWEIFSAGNTWRYRGGAFYNRFPDRNYGLGNDAGLRVQEIEEGDTTTVNYLRFSVQRVTVRPVVVRRLAPNFYGGLQAEFETQYDYQEVPDQLGYPEGSDSVELASIPVMGTRMGIGINLLYDSRDNILNPLNGSYLEFSNHFFTDLLGSDFTYSSYRIDIRKFFNPIKNHTLALRAVGNWRFSPDDEQIPLRGLSRVGGRDFVRGYFFGTYQDNHVLAAEAEYRLPFWPEDTDAPLSKFWKRLGVVGFVGTAQTYGPEQDLRIDAFRVAAGGGLRVLFNPQTRVNIRIDYALGLAPNSNGPDSRQTGLYFFLAEAF